MAEQEKTPVTALMDLSTFPSSSPTEAVHRRELQVAQNQSRDNAAPLHVTSTTEEEQSRPVPPINSTSKGKSKATKVPLSSGYSTVFDQYTNAGNMKPLPIGGPGDVALLFAHEPLDPTKYPIDHIPDALQPQKAPNQTEEEHCAVKRLLRDGTDELDPFWHGIDDESGFDSRLTTPIPHGTVAPREPLNVVTKQVSRAATARPITADLDSDDELIVRMKLDQRTDKAIAKALYDQARVQYNEKTISTRWKRIRQKLAEKREEELEAGFVEWSHEDDALLLQAQDEANRAVQRMKEEAEQQRWAIAAKSLASLNNGSNYSARSCRERWEAIMSSTAVVPPLLDDNVEQRLAELDVKKAAHDRKMHEQAEAKKAEDIRKKEIVKLKARLSAAASRERAKQRAQDGGGLLTVEYLEDGAGIERPQSSQAPSGSETTFTSFNWDQLPTPDNDGDKDIEVPGAKGSFVAHEAKDVSLLNRKAQLALRSEHLPETNSDWLKEMELLPIEEMSREEMRAELRARGHRRGGLKEDLKQFLREARSGGTKQQASSVPPSADQYAKLAKKAGTKKKRKVDWDAFPELADVSNGKQVKRQSLPAKLPGSGEGGKVQSAGRTMHPAESRQCEQPEPPSSSSIDAAFDGTDENEIFAQRATDYQLRGRRNAFSLPSGVSGPSTARPSVEFEFEEVDAATSGLEEHDGEYEE